MAVYCVSPVGWKRRPTYEELVNTDNFKLAYPARTATCVLTNRLMTQFDHIGMFEKE